MKIISNAIATVHKLFLNQFAQRIIQTGFYQVATGVVISTVDGDTWTFTGAHSASENDTLVVLSGPFIGQEFFVKEIVGAAILKTSHKFQPGETVPLNPVTVRIMRAVTAQYDNTGGLTVVPSELSIVDYCDTPFLDASVTNIPKSSDLPLELTASLAGQCKKIKWGDDIGEFIGIYTGAAATEVLHVIVPPGGIEISVDIPAGTRISARHMKNTDIAAGYAAIHFLG